MTSRGISNFATISGNSLDFGGLSIFACLFVAFSKMESSQAFISCINFVLMSLLQQKSGLVALILLTFCFILSQLYC